MEGEGEDNETYLILFLLGVTNAVEGGATYWEEKGWVKKSLGEKQDLHLGELSLRDTLHIQMEMSILRSW